MFTNLNLFSVKYLILSVLYLVILLWCGLLCWATQTVWSTYLLCVMCVPGICVWTYKVVLLDLCELYHTNTQD